MIRDDLPGACDKLYCESGTPCRLNGFHPINLHGLQCFRCMGLHITFRVQPVAPNRKCSNISRVPTARTAGMSGAAAGEASREAITSWSQKHPGYAVITGGSGYRPKCVLLSTFSVRDYGQVLLQETEEICMKEALPNVGWCLRGREDAFTAQSRLFDSDFVGGSVASLTDDVQRLGLDLELRIYEGKLARLFSSLPSVLDFVFLVRLFRGSSLDHTICVDIKRGIIVDSCERYPLHLTSESLIDCAGKDKNTSRISEIR